ncbi:MAG: hypothetical protein UR61_C0030G0006 [candidate division WS6 bacterium GW2011_GWE1_34_7]|uniref:Uncharacterized protein n=1 Tax=candidate division WS6 bacterium GW2011_GWE1_34_7 TaxID=1619093 RepID=A0A0G0DQA2_9BACT|nr:MAG: hypothetical protein UR61_C0030G0006 [candidate division WS6 bacterium GW2011_GWE1_34_7]
MRYIKIFIYTGLILSILNIFLSVYLFNLDVCVLNRGIAFGIRIEYEVLVSILLLIFLIFIGIKTEGFLKYIILSIVGLGLSNLVVRILLNGVCDYIHILNISFNLADIFLVLFSVVGGIFILIKR